MAEAIARALATEMGLADVTIASAGTSAWDGAPASDGALLVAMEQGIDLNQHRSQMLSRELVSEASLVLVMGPHHLERVAALGGKEKAHLLVGFASRGESVTPVADPFSGDLDAYRTTFEELRRTIGQVISRVASDRRASGA